MRRERSDYERMTDSVVLLALWARAQERSGIEAAGDRLKLMKLAFLAAYPLYWDQIKALNLQFFRYTWGPYTGQVSDNWADLSARGLLIEDELFTVTEEGTRLADSFTREVLALEENRPIRSTLNAVAEEFGGVDTATLLKRIYDMRCYTLDSPGHKHKVEAVRMGQAFTGILEEEEVSQSLFIPPGWQITLELTFDPDALRNLQRGIEDTHAGRIYGWDALSTDL